LSVLYLFDLGRRAAISALVPAIAVVVAAQCQATASGRDGYGAANPCFNAKAEMQTDRSRQHVRRF